MKSFFHNQNDKHNIPKKRIISDTFSNDLIPESEIFIKKFDLKLPNFKHITLR